MFKTILVPLDGSAVAETAVGLVRQFVDKGGTVILLRVLGGGRTAESQEEALEYLRSVASSHSAASLKFVCQAEAGDPAAGILNAAAEAEVDLIVLTTRGRSGLARTVLGSVADPLIRKAGVPVLAVPIRALQEKAPPPEEWSRVVVPLDGSSLGERAIAQGAGLARAFGARLILARVVPPPHAPELEALRPEGARPPYTSARAAADAQAYLKGVAASHRLSENEVDLTVLVGWTVASLADLASGDGLLVMSGRGLGGFNRMVMGSVAGGLLHEARSPIVFVPLQG